jgi:hypothetical protein
MQDRTPLPARLCAAGLLATLLAAAPVIAQEEIDRRFPFEADGSLEVTNLIGSITLIGEERDDVRLFGWLGEGTEGLEIDDSPRHLEIEVDVPRHLDDVEESHLEFRLPAGARISVMTLSADVLAEGLTGQLDIETISGDIDLAGDLSTIDIESVSGTIEIHASAGHLSITSISGDVRLAAERGALDLETVSGDARVVLDQCERLQCQTVSGDLRLSVGLEPDGECEISSHSGNVVLELPEGIDAELSITTFSGDIDTELGDPVRIRRRPGGREMHLILGEGSARVDITTFSGEVDLRYR